MCSSGSEWQDVINNDNNQEIPVTYEVKIGIITDAHYSAKENSNGRYYSASKQKISEAVQVFNNAGVDMAISLGDLVDNEYTDYSDIQVELAKLSMPMYKILGNHDFITPFSEEQQSAAIKVLGITNRYFSPVRRGLSEKRKHLDAHAGPHLDRHHKPCKINIFGQQRPCDIFASARV